MCSDDPTLNKAQKSGKCWGIVCLVFGIITCSNIILMALGAGPTLALLGGILLIIAGSMVLCCLSPQNARCYFKSAMVLAILAGVAQLTGAIILLTWIIAINEATDDNDAEEFGDAVNNFLTIVMVLDVICMTTFFAAAYKFFKAMQASAGISVQPRGAPEA